MQSKGTLCGSVDSYWHFRGTCSPHLQNRSKKCYADGWRSVTLSEPWDEEGRLIRANLKSHIQTTTVALIGHSPLLTVYKPSVNTPALKTQAGWSTKHNRTHTQVHKESRRKRHLHNCENLKSQFGPLRANGFANKHPSLARVERNDAMLYVHAPTFHTLQILFWTGIRSVRCWLQRK